MPAVSMLDATPTFSLRSRVRRAYDASFIWRSCLSQFIHWTNFLVSQAHFCVLFDESAIIDPQVRIHPVTRHIASRLHALDFDLCCLF